jgi:hypothetical protein
VLVDPAPIGSYVGNSSNQMAVRMKLANLIAACAILSFALANEVAAQDAATAPRPGAIGTVGENAATRSKGDDLAASRNNNLRKSDENSGRKGFSCQRDTLFKGQDGQMHLCK